MAGGDGGADMGCQFRRQPAPERQALGRGVGFGRARQHGVGQPALPQGSDRECLDRGRERRQRAQRRGSGAADGGDLLLGDDQHQRGDEIVLGREIAVDGAGGDAGALRDLDDLHRARRHRGAGDIASLRTTDLPSLRLPPHWGDRRRLFH
jgi:hypothetical protein